jgi:hypothetical protein
VFPTADFAQSPEIACEVFVAATFHPAEFERVRWPSFSMASSFAHPSWP